MRHTVLVLQGNPILVVRPHVPGKHAEVMAAGVLAEPVHPGNRVQQAGHVVRPLVLEKRAEVMAAGVLAEPVPPGNRVQQAGNVV